MICSPSRASAGILNPLGDSSREPEIGSRNILAQIHVSLAMKIDADECRLR